MARPKLELNKKEIENYATLGASNREIAKMLGVDQGTIRKRFSAVLAKARGTRRLKLRSMQWKAAETGNVAMLIFLGKNELGQSDRQAHEHTGKAGGPIETLTKHAIDYDQLRKDLEAFAGSGTAGGRVSANGNGKPVHSDHAN